VSAGCSQATNQASSSSCTMTCLHNPDTHSAGRVWNRPGSSQSPALHRASILATRQPPQPGTHLHSTVAAVLQHMRTIAQNSPPVLAAPTPPLLLQQDRTAATRKSISITGPWCQSLAWGKRQREPLTRPLMSASFALPSMPFTQSLSSLPWLSWASLATWQKHHAQPDTAGHTSR